MTEINKGNQGPIEPKRVGTVDIKFHTLPDQYPYSADGVSSRLLTPEELARNERESIEKAIWSLKQDSVQNDLPVDPIKETKIA